jgi:hypothetical protein
MNPLLLGPLADIIKSVITRIWPDPAQQADAQFKLAQLMQTGELAQLAAETDLAKAQIGVNNTEAQSEGLFKSGWRPFIGWVCGSAFAWNYVVQPVAKFTLVACGYVVPNLPTLNLAMMMPVMLGMLGLGALRTYDKQAANQ